MEGIHGLLMGRVLPAGDVGYPGSQLRSQLSGDGIARPTGACRPTSDFRSARFMALNLTLVQLWALGLAGSEVRASSLSGAHWSAASINPSRAFAPGEPAQPGP